MFQVVQWYFLLISCLLNRPKCDLDEIDKKCFKSSIGKLKFLPKDELKKLLG